MSASSYTSKRFSRSDILLIAIASTPLNHYYSLSRQLSLRFCAQCLLKTCSKNTSTCLALCMMSQLCTSQSLHHRKCHSEMEDQIFVLLPFSILCLLLRIFTPSRKWLISVTPSLRMTTAIGSLPLKKMSRRSCLTAHIQCLKAPSTSSSSHLVFLSLQQTSTHLSS